jgi:pimeloyl-ACP methyl ester carboxylesterase
MTSVVETVRTGTIRVGDDAELYYERRGAHGPAVVLIPNFFMDATSWRPFTDALEHEHQLIAYDLRGQGGSSRPEAEPAWADHIGDLEVLVDELALGRVFLVGTSFSALLCRDFAIAHPDRVAGIVFAGPAISPWGSRRHRRIIRAWLHAMDAVGLPALYDLMYALVSGDCAAEAAGTAGFLGRKQAFLALHTQEEVRSGMAVSLTADADPALLTEVACPTLVVAGDDDFSLGVSAVEEMVRLLPEGSSLILPKVGHIPFIEEPAIFQAEVAAFFAGIGAGND